MNDNRKQADIYGQAKGIVSRVVGEVAFWCNLVIGLALVILIAGTILAKTGWSPRFLALPTVGESWLLYICAAVWFHRGGKL